MEKRTLSKVILLVLTLLWAGLPATATPRYYFAGTIEQDGLQYSLYYATVDNVTTYEARVSAVSPSTLTGAVTIAESVSQYGRDYVVKAILADAFRNSPITSVDLPSGVETIGDYAFASTPNLRHIEIPSNVNYVDDYVFDGSGIEEIYFPGHCRRVGNGAIRNCPNLKAAHMNRAIAEGGLFGNCPNLTEVSWALTEENETYVMLYGISSTFFESTFNKGKCTLTVPKGTKKYYTMRSVFKGFKSYKESLGFDNYDKNFIYQLRDNNVAWVGGQYGSNTRNLDIPTQVTFSGTTYIVQAVMADGFAGNTSLQSIKMGDYVASIQDRAFSGCTGLTKVVLDDDNMYWFSNRAFENCTSLPEITLGATMLLLSDKVFSGCTSLKDIYYGSMNIIEPTSSGDSPFDGFDKTQCDLWLPNSKSKELLATDLWKGFKKYHSYYEYEDENLSYELDHLNGTAIVRGKNNKQLEGTITIPATITHNGSTFTVTTIGYFAFSSQPRLKRVVIPTTVTHIQHDAFHNSGALESITWNSNSSDPITIEEGAFTNCFGLTKLKLPNGVTSIPDGMFSACRGLREIDLPRTVTSVNMGAFSDCWQLRALIVRASDKPTFTGKFNGPDLYLYRGGYWQPGSIGVQGMSTIEPDAEFSDRFIFSNFDWDSMTCTLSGRMEIDYTGKLTLPDFDQISYRWKVTKIAGKAFMQTGSKNMYTKLELPAYVEEIDNGVFSGARITDVYLPNTLKKINDIAFSNSLLKTIKVPSGVTEIRSIVMNCSELEKVLLPSTTTTITASVLTGCSNVTRLAIKATTPPSTPSRNGAIAFSDFDKSKCVLVVPAGTLDSYKALPAYQGFKAYEQVSESAQQHTFYDDVFLFTVEDEWLAPDEVSIAYDGQSNIVITELNLPPYGPDSNTYEWFDVTSIAMNGFTHLPAKVEKLNVPGCITTIQDMAFAQGRTKHVEFEEGVEVIGYYAFSNSSVERVDLPSTITQIGEAAFWNANSLSEVHCSLTDPIDISNSDLTQRGKQVTCYVPQEHLAKFQDDSEWSKLNLVGYADTPAVPGDVNGDDSVDTNDITSLVNIIINQGDDSGAGDLNGDGNVDANDLSILINIILRQFGISCLLLEQT